MGSGTSTKWAVVAALAGAALVAAACLPDLASLPTTIDDTPTTKSSAVCGNGVVEPYDDGGTETCDPGDAGVPGCSTCQVTCEGTRDKITQHCYFKAGARGGIADANELCRAQDAHLVTLGSAREAALVSSLAEGSTFWVGLAAEAALGAYGTRSVGVDPGLEPGWPEPAKGTGPCPGCWGLGRDGGGFDPLDDAGATAASFACVASSSGLWFGVPCAGVSPEPETICEREPRGQRSQICGGAFCFTLPATATTKSYVVVPGFTTADEAQKSCASYPSGRLVVLESSEEREELVRELATVLPFPIVLEVQGYWIGLSAPEGGAWAWLDGKSESDRPVPWSDKEPRAPSGDAYLRLVAEQYDTGLVSVETSPAVTHPYVCERAP